MPLRAQIASAWDRLYSTGLQSSHDVAWSHWKSNPARLLILCRHASSVTSETLWCFGVPARACKQTPGTRKKRRSARETRPHSPLLSSALRWCITQTPHIKNIEICT